MEIEQIHTRFSEFLSLKLSKDRCDEIVDCVEKSLSEYIRKYFDSKFVSAYTLTDHNYYKKIRSNVFSNEAANEENDRNGQIFTEALRYYSLFLDSKIFKGKEKVYLTIREKDEHKAKNAIQSSATKLQEDPLLPPDNAEDELTEGRIRQVNITKHERNRVLRQKCLQHYGYVCQVCGMDFKQRYGNIGKDFIEVHHLYPISTTDGEHQVDAILDLVPLCCNCHSMIHRGGNNGVPMKLEELIEAYKQNNH